MGELQSDFYKNLTEFYQISLKKLPYLTDFSPLLMAYMTLRGIAVVNAYPHDNCADKDSYTYDSNIQCIILRLQLSFAMINVQLMFVSLFFDICSILQQICVNIIIFICS